MSIKKRKIIEVNYNWLAISDRDSFQRIAIGEMYETTHGLLKCVEIREKEDFVEIEFEDGSVEKQWNLNKIIYEGVELDKA